MDWTFDPDTNRLKLTKMIPPRYSTERGDRAWNLVIRPVDVGLSARFSGDYGLDETIIIPGDYPLEAVAEHLADKYHCDTVAVSDLLLETEIWYARGYLANPKTFPKEIFAKVPIADFLAGGVKSYKRWMNKVIYGHRVFRGLGTDRIERLIADGTYPERLHSLRNWNTLAFEDLPLAIRYKAHRHPRWGVFTSQYYATYRDILDHHHEAWEEIDAFMEACVRFPKTETVRGLFDQVYAHGGSLRATERMKTARQLANHVEVLVERSATLAQQTTIYEYRPPTIELPDGWRWADKTTFWSLSELYNCCINRNSYYSNALKNGDAAVAYRPNFNCETDRGALCFFTRTGRKWEIREIRGWTNTTVQKTYESQAQRILRDIQDLADSQEAERRRELDKTLRDRARAGRAAANA
jgi:hypothetical protein